MNAASELFLSHGYAGVSLAAVMAETGGSFRDIYREFGSKEGLFLRAMQYLCDQIVSPWRSLDLHESTLEVALIAFGKALMTSLLSPRLLALHRLILAEATKFPELAHVWYESAPYATSEALAELLVARARSERLNLKNPRVEAGALIDSIVNDLQLRRLVGLLVTEAEVDERIRACVHVFLNGVRNTTAGNKQQRGKRSE